MMVSKTSVEKFSTLGTGLCRVRASDPLYEVQPSYYTLQAHFIISEPHRSEGNFLLRHMITQHAIAQVVGI